MSVSILETADERIHSPVPLPAFSPAKLRAARARSSLTVAQLATALVRDVRTVRRYQSGAMLPPTEVVCALSAALGVPIGDLFDGSHTSG